MRLKTLLILPIISFIGLSISLHFFGSIIIGLVFKTFKPRDKSSDKESDRQVVDGRKDREMWKCRKCGKPVYFAERKCSLGYDWHPSCLTCYECGKRVNPGQHAEVLLIRWTTSPNLIDCQHKGIPYCYIPCYGALFGPQLYGHGSQVESHSSFGQKSKLNSNQMFDKLLEQKLKEYNQYYEGKSNAIQYRERNGRFILEGTIKIYWDVSNVIQLKEDNDDRIFIRRRSYYINRNSSRNDSDDSSTVSTTSSPDSGKQSGLSSDSASSPESPSRNCQTLPTRGSESARKLREELKRATKSFDDEYVQQISDSKQNNSSENNDKEEVVLRRTCNLRRSRVRLKRRCSINGHFYNRETSIFTPAHGSVTSVFTTSLLNAPEVINLLLDKFKVTNNADDFSLFVLKDNGECRRLQDNEFPLIVRVLLGPNESVAKVFIFNKNKDEVSCEVAQYLRLSNAELQMFLKKFEEEEIREINKIKKKYFDLKKWIKIRIKELESSETSVA